MPDLVLTQVLKSLRIKDELGHCEVNKKNIWVLNEWRDVFYCSELDFESQTVVWDVTQIVVLNHFIVRVVLLGFRINFQLNQLTNVCSKKLIVLCFFWKALGLLLASLKENSLENFVRKIDS